MIFHLNFHVSPKATFSVALLFSGSNGAIANIGSKASLEAFLLALPRTPGLKVRISGTVEQWSSIYAAKPTKKKIVTQGNTRKLYYNNTPHPDNKK